jgi:ERCC4-related helicase
MPRKNNLQNDQEDRSIIDEIIDERDRAYSAMSLLELLREENMITEILHSRGLDPVRQRLQQMLRSHIEKKLI